MKLHRIEPVILADMKGSLGFFILLVGFTTFIIFGELTPVMHDERIPAYDMTRCISITGDISGCVDAVRINPAEDEEQAQEQTLSSA